MSGWKKIKEMIKDKKLADVKSKELKNYLQTEGYKTVEGGKHTTITTKDGRRLSSIPRQRTLRKDQLRYILKQVGRF